MINRRQFLGGLLAISSPRIFAADHCDVPVLMYHHIGSDSMNSYSVYPIQFEDHMMWLYNNGYEPISVYDLDNAKPNNFVLTFDDGYYSFIEHAFPILQKLNWVSTINLVGKWIGDVVPDVKEHKSLSWDDIIMLDNSGLVDFGCHTYDLHHPNSNVIEVSPEEIVEDLLKFQEIYTKHLGKSVDIIAWPYGRYNDDAIDAAESVGFRYFLTSQHGPYRGNPYRIERIHVERNADFGKVVRQNSGTCI